MECHRRICHILPLCCHPKIHCTARLHRTSHIVSSVDGMVECESGGGSDTGFPHPIRSMSRPFGSSTSKSVSDLDEQAFSLLIFF